MRTFISLITILLSLNISAQVKSEEGRIMRVDFTETHQSSSYSAKEFFANDLKLDNSERFNIQKVKHYQKFRFEYYQQYYNGIKVEDGYFTFKYKDGAMRVAQGHQVPVAGMTAKPSLSENEALSVYIQHFHLEKYHIEKTYSELLIKGIPIESAPNKTKVAYHSLLPCHPRTS